MWKTTVMPTASAPVPTETGKKPPQQWLRWGIPIAAFVIGVGVGGAGGESDVEASPAYMTLRSELTESQEEAAGLSDQVADAEARVQQATEAGAARLVQQRAELEGLSAQLDQREQALVAREAAAVVATTQAPAPPPPAPVASVPAAPVPEAAPQAPSSTYYQNCDAVRAAGAAPIRTGDPGYAGHLDRDGDGVACE